MSHRPLCLRGSHRHRTKPVREPCPRAERSPRPGSLRGPGPAARGRPSNAWGPWDPSPGTRPPTLGATVPGRASRERSGKWGPSGSWVEPRGTRVPPQVSGGSWQPPGELRRHVGNALLRARSPASRIPSAGSPVSGHLGPLSNGLRPSGPPFADIPQKARRANVLC